MEAHLSSRLSVDGRFFRINGSKFYPKGVTYGPFAPNGDGETFPSRAQTERDFAQIQELGANLIRVYYVPPRWLLDLAETSGLKVFIDIPWEKHRCFLETYEMREAARECVRKAVKPCAGHPAIFAYSVTNEVPADIARWHGARETAEFIDELVEEVKRVDKGALCTFASFPPTEFLQPQRIDFVTFNVYLHERETFEPYLARLQTLAGEKPLLLGEFGMDSMREGEEHQAATLGWQVEAAFRGGAAGTILFSFTDDWHRGGTQITDWAFGMTTRERKPKRAFSVVQACFGAAPYFPLPRTPKVSVVVASYNGAGTLRPCLASLGGLNYPDYEVILVDDGSTDNTPQIAAEFPSVRTIRQRNLGLSAARNVGIAAARGELVAFTDSDCRADEDWLHYLVGDLLRSNFAGIGGHNFLPPEDSPVAAAVMVSPGGPAHVMLTDREAEHIPGCNMMFYKRALDEINGFDPLFRKAGDDVDVCWRLQENGGRIGFSAAGFVWHYRRSTVKAYLRQQAGYGEAEAMLAQKHPKYFNMIGGGVWRGRIYSAGVHAAVGQAAVIYHGIFGSGFFQRLYVRQPSLALLFCTSLPYHVFVTLPLGLLTAWMPELLPLPVGAALLPAAVCCAAAWQARLPADKERLWSRGLIALLHLLQPVCRGWARFRRRIDPALPPVTGRAPQYGRENPAAAATPGFWSRNGTDRYTFLAQLQQCLKARGWAHRCDTGWDDFDLEVAVNRWSVARIRTASEELSGGRQFIRCRVVNRWSGFSWLVATLILGTALAVPLLIAERCPWSWMTLAVFSLACLWMEDRQRHPASVLTRAVSDAAASLGLEPFRTDSPGVDASESTRSL